MNSSKSYFLIVSSEKTSTALPNVRIGRSRRHPKNETDVTFIAAYLPKQTITNIQDGQQSDDKNERHQQLHQWRENGLVGDLGLGGSARVENSFRWRRGCCAQTDLMRTQHLKRRLCRREFARNTSRTTRRWRWTFIHSSMRPTKNRCIERIVAVRHCKSPFPCCVGTIYNNVF